MGCMSRLASSVLLDPRHWLNTPASGTIFNLQCHSRSSSTGMLLLSMVDFPGMKKLCKVQAAVAPVIQRMFAVRSGWTCHLSIAKSKVQALPHAHRRNDVPSSCATAMKRRMNFTAALCCPAASSALHCWNICMPSSKASACPMACRCQ
jgi:hypothetical protein